MSLKRLYRDVNKISKIATIIIFLALIRTISEPFRLQHYSKISLTYDEIEPFLIGAFIAAIGLLAMTILYYFGKHKIIIAASILIIIILLLVKKFYLIP